MSLHVNDFECQQAPPPFADVLSRLPPDALLDLALVAAAGVDLAQAQIASDPLEALKKLVTVLSAIDNRARQLLPSARSEGPH